MGILLDGGEGDARQGRGYLTSFLRFTERVFPSAGLVNTRVGW
jgi:hypothetical protein